MVYSTCEPCYCVVLHALMVYWLPSLLWCAHTYVLRNWPTSRGCKLVTMELAYLDSRSFYDQFVTEWAPEVAKRYPLSHVGIKELTPEEVCTYTHTYVQMYLGMYIHTVHTYVQIYIRM